MGNTTKRTVDDEARFPTKEEVNQSRVVFNPPPEDKIEDRIEKQVEIENG